MASKTMPLSMGRPGRQMECALLRNMKKADERTTSMQACMHGPERGLTTITASHSHCRISLNASVHIITMQLTEYAPDSPHSCKRLAWACSCASLRASSNAFHVAPSFLCHRQRRLKNVSSTLPKWLCNSISTISCGILRYVDTERHLWPAFGRT